MTERTVCKFFDCGWCCWDKPEGPRPHSTQGQCRDHSACPAWEPRTPPPDAEAKATSEHPLVRQVASLKWGWNRAILKRELEMEFPGYEYNGAWFNPADQILEKIIGSAREFSYRVLGDRVIFSRHRPWGTEVFYTSPDRRVPKGTKADW